MYEINIKNKLQELTGSASVKLTVPPPNVEGDLSTNAAMSEGVRAENIASGLEELDCIQWAKVTGPGFINIKISDNALWNELKEILDNPSMYGRIQHAGKVIFEMVSSNPTGPLHIGHGRGAAIGDSMARIFSWSGYGVFREYYVNDAGRQMNLLGESIFNRIQGKEIPDGGYKGEYINEIAMQLKGCVSQEECSEYAGKLILKSHIDVLKEFGVEYDNLFSEKELIKENKVKEIIEIFKKNNLTYEKDGALWFNSSKFGDDMDRVLIKKSGGLTYFASDCAYHNDKAGRFPNLVNIWGADHHGYIPRIMAFWKALGFEGRKKIDILLYQLVNLKRGNERISMSTRAGEFVTLKDVIDEVGKDAARFFLLMRSADAPLEFDLELAKQESKKNPVYYVQYSHARICSVFKKSGRSPESLDSMKVTELASEEREIIKMLAHFPYLLYKCIDLMAPHLITDYLRETATVFHKYYDVVRVLGSEKEEPRLLLLKAVKEIIKNGLYLVGVSAPESM